MITEGIEERLLKILNYAYENSEYYKLLFDKYNINLQSDIYDIMQTIPITTKIDLVNHYNELLCKTEKIIKKENTSGSTGVPIVCQKTNNERVIAGLSIWKQRKKHDNSVNANNFLSVWNNKYVRDNLIYLNEENIVNTLRYILDQNPRWLSGPISVLEKYAKYIENGSVKYSGCINFVELIGEYSTIEQRQYIEDIFGCVTTNLYGIREAWCIAYECPQKHLHVLDNDLYLEIIDKNQIKDLSKGEIIITSYNNLRMPLIRYNTNDLAKKSNVICDCGNSSPIIELCGGRTMDIIYGKDILGNVFFGRVTGAVNRTFLHSIESFKVEQIATNKFVYYVAKGIGFKEEALFMLSDMIKKELGQYTKIEYIFCNSIGLLNTGKKRVFQVKIQ